MNEENKNIDQIYRLNLNPNEQKELMWKELKAIFEKCDWNYGIYEKDRVLESRFELGNDRHRRFTFAVKKDGFYSLVNIVTRYPRELTDDFFLLTTHFNNHLDPGIVRVDVKDQNIIFSEKKPLLVPLLYPKKMREQIVRHIDNSSLLVNSYERLIDEQEEPTIIIADLLNDLENEDE